MRYLEVFVVRSISFKCAYDNAKRSFYNSAVNGIVGKVLNIASEDVILQLIVNKYTCPYSFTGLRHVL